MIEKDTLPADLEVTAWSPDGEIMGVRHRTLPIEGVQFHPESIASEGGQTPLEEFPDVEKGGLRLSSPGPQDHGQAAPHPGEAEGFMEELTEGNLSGTQIAAVLVGLSLKGIAPEEVAGCAAVLQRKRTPLPVTGDFPRHRGHRRRRARHVQHQLAGVAGGGGLRGPGGQARQPGGQQPLGVGGFLLGPWGSRST